MITLPYLTAIHFTGIDAGTFLHNQLSADVLALAVGESTFACYCEPKGRVLALLLAYHDAEGYYAILSKALAQSLAKRFKIYVMRAEVSIEIPAEIVIAGLSKDDGLQLPASSLAAIPVPECSDLLIIKSDASAVQADASLQDAWKFSELQRGICWLDAASSGQFLPQMLGLDNLGAVNFHKGCYPGQEIVARTHYLGKVKRHPRFVSSQINAVVATMDKINIRSTETTYAAIVVDSATHTDGSNFLFVVTRMDPDLPAEGIQLEEIQ